MADFQGHLRRTDQSSSLEPPTICPFRFRVVLRLGCGRGISHLLNVFQDHKVVVLFSERPNFLPEIRKKYD